MKSLLVMLLVAMPLAHEAPIPAKIVAPEPVILLGTASYYGEEWTLGHGHRGIMANGKPFNPRALTAASYDIPLGTHVLVYNMLNDREIEVIITDRGPKRKLNRLIDLSQAAARRLGYIHRGTTLVVVTMK